MQIRNEQESDYLPIERLTKAAFEGKPYSSGTEEYLAQKLRDDNALTISLVAVVEGDVVGHIAISKVHIDGENHGYFGVGPLAVLPKMQGSGVGTKLLKSALSKLEDMAASCCVLVGDPNYYSRMGFELEKEIIYTGAPAEYFQSIRFSDDRLVGEVKFHSAFE